MPKKVIEINKFTGGIVSTPSASDTDIQSAKYSSNVDPQTSDGRLQGIDKDQVLTSVGFKENDTESTLLVMDNMKEGAVLADKDDKNKVNINWQ